MSGTRSVQGAGLLILLTAGVLGASQPVELVSPLDGDIVAGATEFSFRVHAAEPAVERIDVYIEGLLIGSAAAPTWSFIWTPRQPLRDTQIVAVALGAHGVIQKLSIRTSDMSFGEFVNVVEVQLFPVVQDQRGHYIPHLTKADFVLLEEGREIEIETFSSQPTPLTLAMLIDVSRSMFYKLQLVQEASVGLLDALGPDDVVTLYAFNHGVRRILAPTTDLEEAKEQVRSLWANGRTALYDAVVRVLNDLEAIPGRRVLVVFSDGRDDRRLTTLKRVVRAARRSEAVVYTIGAGEGEEDLAARKDLEAMATASGGEAHVIDKLEALPATFAAILSDVRAQYRLTFTPPPAASGIRRVEVRTKEEEYRVRCRTSYSVKGDAP